MTEIEITRILIVLISAFAIGYMVRAFLSPGR